MRVDSGVVSGDVIGGAFDSMLAKLIVTGADRQQALERSRRALAEFVVEGMPTVLPFHRAVVADPAFATDDETPFSVHTRWIETEWDNTDRAVRPGHCRAAASSRRSGSGSSSRSAASGSRSCCRPGSASATARRGGRRGGAGQGSAAYVGRLVGERRRR